MKHHTSFQPLGDAGYVPICSCGFHGALMSSAVAAVAAANAHARAQGAEPLPAETPESEARYVREAIFERGELRATGDTLQSSASRIAEWILSLTPVAPAFVPYEVHMAALEAQSAVEQWTEIRRKA